MFLVPMIHFTVTLAKGVPVVYFGPEYQLEPAVNGGIDLADGEWHQIGISMPEKSVEMASDSDKDRDTHIRIHAARHAERVVDGMEPELVSGTKIVLSRP